MGVLSIQQKPSSKAREIYLECDVCKTHYVTWYRKSYLTRKNYFCSYNCMGVSRKKGNILYRRTKQTMLQKYGVGNPSQSNFFKKKKEQTCLQNFGVCNPKHSKEIENKRLKTLYKKYGVDNPLKSREIKEKIDFKKSWKKAHETKKNTGAYNGRSKLEKRFESVLKNKFDSVATSLIINEGEVDFYIRDIDVYVQFDGKYWHGLDRPLSEIKASNKMRDKHIVATYQRDRKQDEWFKSKGKKLVRVTDEQFQKFIKEGRELQAHVLVNG